MIDAIRLIVRYQTYIYLFICLAALVYLRSLWQARRYLNRTPFGLEREVALRKQNSAVGMLTVLVLLAVSVYLTGLLVLPTLLARSSPPETPVVPTPTPSPVAAPGVIVDSSGCENPQATLTAPKPYERIAGAFEVRGTASIQNFAFYKFEISGAGTGGEWVSLGVGTDPKPDVDSDLGRFDTTDRAPGEYAFRLIVYDSAGNFPAPCVVPIEIVSLGAP